MGRTGSKTHVSWSCAAGRTKCPGRCPVGIDAGDDLEPGPALARALMGPFTAALARARSLQVLSTPALADAGGLYRLDLTGPRPEPTWQGGAALVVAYSHSHLASAGLSRAARSSGLCYLAHQISYSTCMPGIASASTKRRVPAAGLMFTGAKYSANKPRI